jgi:hypothetical protein
MPQPTATQVHIDAILSNISVAYVQSQDSFIADKVFPIVPVDKKSNKYFVYTKNDWFRDEAERRADATESAGGGYNLSTDSYLCDVFAFHKDIGDQTVANADAPLSPERDAAMFVTQRLLLRREIQWVTDYFTTGVWGTDMTGVAASPTGNQFTKWSNYATSDPINDIEQGKETVLSTTGFMPNTLVLGYRVFRQLKNHPDLVDRIKYTSSSVLSTEMIAQLFDVERVLVAKAVKATNNEGGTAAYNFAFGDSAMLTYVAPDPGVLTPSSGYTFAWNGVSDGLGLQVGTSSFRMEHLRAQRIESEMAWDNKVVGADLGYFLSAAI